MNHDQITGWAQQLSEIESRRERTTDKIAAGILVFAVFLFAAIVLAFDEPRPLECITDTECAALCPIDDTECDGGPQ